MHRDREAKSQRPKSYKFISILILLLTIAVVGFLFTVLRFREELSERYHMIIVVMEMVEEFIIGIPNKWIAFFMIFFVFFIKSYMPFLPMSMLCLITGVVFEWPYSLVINMMGLMLMFYLRFNSGRVKGDGYAHKMLRRNKYVRMLLEMNGGANMWLLGLFRLIPIFPINFVSRLYGAMHECKFSYYMLFSTVAVLPRVYLYTRIGREIFNPFSRAFLMTLIFLAIFSGISAFTLYTAFSRKSKRDSILRQQRKELEAAEQEEQFNEKQGDLAKAQEEKKDTGGANESNETET